MPVDSLRRAAEVAAAAVEACGSDADDHLHVDLRPNRVMLTLQTRTIATLTARDVAQAHQISAALHNAATHNLDPARQMSAAPHEADIPNPAPADRMSAALHDAADPDLDLGQLQILDIAIDALDIAAIRPFWKAVLAYVDKPGGDGTIIDPLGLSPVVWFQQMDAPRPQRNRIHFDIAVPHDVAEARVEAALAAGGRLVSADRAPAFWVLADAEGNEACVTTWEGRGD